MKWFAEMVHSFECPECGQQVPEGNPKECPHQQGRPARYSGKKPVVNAAKLIAVLSMQPKAPSTPKADPVKKADAVSAKGLMVTGSHPPGVRCYTTGTRGVDSWGTQRLSRMFMEMTQHRNHRSRSPHRSQPVHRLKTYPVLRRNYLAASRAGGPFGSSWVTNTNAFTDGTSSSLAFGANERTEKAMFNETDIQEFTARLRGELIQRGDPRYEKARKVFNGMIDKRPALIVRCAGVADVIAAVNFARETHVVAAIRGGGHGVGGNAVCNDGLVIDLSAMKSVQVDRKNQVARAEGGATWGDFDHETQAFGLATTGGIVPSTGIAGLTLGGGIGYLNRKHGLACDNLLCADVVTADGQLRRASAEEHDDLFWGLRGGGGNFGVVTAFQYRLHPVGPVLGGEIVYPLNQAKKVLRFYRDWSSAAPDELRADATLLSGPHGPALDIIVCYCGRLDEGEQVLRPLRSCGSPTVDTVAPVPYRTVQNLLTEVFQPGFLHSWKSGFLRTFSDDAIEAIVDFFAGAVPGFFAAIAIEHLGGAVNRAGPHDTAFNHRDAQHSLLALRMWPDPADSEANIDWVRRCYRTAEPFLKGGVYVNYLGDEGEARIRAAYGANYDRLAAIKSKYDPTNFFRQNQNIKPA